MSHSADIPVCDAVHGNCFMERCPTCSTYYLRDFEMNTVGLKATGRSCTKGRCR
jgi:NAD+-dependent protein deacetylase sirtuin 6